MSEDVSSLKSQYKRTHQALTESTQPTDAASHHETAGEISRRIGIRLVLHDVLAAREWFGRAATHYIESTQLYRDHTSLGSDARFPEPIRCQQALFVALRARNREVEEEAIALTEGIPVEYRDEYQQDGEVFVAKTVASLIEGRDAQAALFFESYEDFLADREQASHLPEETTPLIRPILSGFIELDGARVSQALEHGFERASDISNPKRRDALQHQLVALYLLAAKKGLQVRVTAPSIQTIVKALHQETEHITQKESPERSR